MARYWQGSEPSHCEHCGNPLHREFYDAATSTGWRLLCKACHKMIGHGLGIGIGERYAYRPDSKLWEKEATEMKPPKPKPLDILKRIDWS